MGTRSEQYRLFNQVRVIPENLAPQVTKPLKKLTQPQLVTIALLELGGASEACDTEDIAVQVDELAPGVFVWRKHRDRIDKELVRVALSDAKRKHSFVAGSHNGGGWMLTPQGQAFAEATAVESDGKRITPRIDPTLGREKARIIASPTFASFQASGTESISDDDADSLFRLSVYVTGDVREKQILRIENAFASDPEIGEVVRAMAEVSRGRGTS